MKVAIILNGISRNKKKFYRAIYPPIQQEFGATVLETLFAGHAESLAAQAVADGYDVVMAAGGDGTLHQVVNGIMKQEGARRPILGLIPLGTGNDFARTCSLNPDASQITALLRNPAPKPTDAGQINCIGKNGQPTTRYFINVCSLGMGPEVVKRLVKSNRQWGPVITYYTSIIVAFFSHRPVEVFYKTAKSEWKGNPRVIAIANGKSFGNAMFVAPDALIDDGQFSSFIAAEIPLLRFLLYLQKIKGKRKIMDQKIHYQNLAWVDLAATEPVMLEADGEIEGFLPATVKVLHRSIGFLR